MSAESPSEKASKDQQDYLAKFQKITQEIEENKADILKMAELQEARKQLIADVPDEQKQKMQEEHDILTTTERTSAVADYNATREDVLSRTEKDKNTAEIEAKAANEQLATLTTESTPQDVVRINEEATAANSRAANTKNLYEFAQQSYPDHGTDIGAWDKMLQSAQTIPEAPPRRASVNEALNKEGQQEAQQDVENPYRTLDEMSADEYNQPLYDQAGQAIPGSKAPPRSDQAADNLYESPSSLKDGEQVFETIKDAAANAIPSAIPQNDRPVDTPENPQATLGQEQASQAPIHVDPQNPSHVPFLDELSKALNNKDGKKLSQLANDMIKSGKITKAPEGFVAMKDGKVDIDPMKGPPDGKTPFTGMVLTQRPGTNPPVFDAAEYKNGKFEKGYIADPSAESGFSKAIQDQVRGQETGRAATQEQQYAPPQQQRQYGHASSVLERATRQPASPAHEQQPMQPAAYSAPQHQPMQAPQRNEAPSPDRIDNGQSNTQDQPQSTLSLSQQEITEALGLMRGILNTQKDIEKLSEQSAGLFKGFDEKLKELNKIADSENPDQKRFDLLLQDIDKDLDQIDELHGKIGDLQKDIEDKGQRVDKILGIEPAPNKEPLKAQEAPSQPQQNPEVGLQPEPAQQQRAEPTSPTIAQPPQQSAPELHKEEPKQGMEPVPAAKQPDWKQEMRESLKISDQNFDDAATRHANKSRAALTEAKANTPTITKEQQQQLDRVAQAAQAAQAASKGQDQIQR